MPESENNDKDKITKLYEKINEDRPLSFEKIQPSLGEEGDSVQNILSEAKSLTDAIGKNLNKERIADNVTEVEFKKKEKEEK